MNIRALEAQAKALAPVLRGLIDKAVSALSSRIDAVERALGELPSIEDAVKEAVASLPPAKDGKDAEVDLDQIVREVLARVPAPKDGADGQPGKSLTPDDIRPLVAEEVAKAVAAIPKAKDGEPGRDGRDGQPGIPGRDGVDGKDGLPGADGKDGKDGADGLGFDDLNIEYDGERTISLVFTRGETVKRFDLAMPVVIDKGVYRHDEKHQRGDAVTYGGSLWIAQKDAPGGKPGESDDWRLAVKKGRDGRDGQAGERGERGAEGRPGRDLTQLGFDGSKT